LIGETKRDWRRIAIDAAERAGRRSVRVTRVSIDPDRGRVAVETVLLGRHPGDGAFRAEQHHESWKTVWTKSLSASPTNVRPGAVEQVRSDPRVKQIIDATQALGLTARLDEALALGAVVLDLNQAVQDAWLIESNKVLTRLDLYLPSPALYD
jgi:hypothetical protein